MEDIVKTYLKWLNANNIPKDKHEFLVLYSDDDFMGNGNVEEIYDSIGKTLESSDLQRAERISEGFYNISKKYDLDIQWGISTRSDAVYRPIIKEEEYTRNIPGYIKLDTEEQNEKREKIWLALKKNGLKSVFIGIDSGSPSQLKRYGKLTTPIHNEEAIKFLKKIGIQLFVGFITFDPLMNLQELTENIEFMKRNDIYESITNPLSSLRITEGTPYKKMAQSFGILGSKTDDSWTYNAIYINPLINIINVITQEWTKNQYSLVYAIKGQAIKDSKDINKAMWWKCLETFKSLDFELLTELTETATYFSKKFSITENDWRNLTQSRLKRIQPSSYIEEKMIFINEESTKIYFVLKKKRHLHIQNHLTKINRGEIKDTDFIIANEIYKSNSQNV